MNNHKQPRHISGPLVEVLAKLLTPEELQQVAAKARDASPDYFQVCPSCNDSGNIEPTTPTSKEEAKLYEDSKRQLFFHAPEGWNWPDQCGEGHGFCECLTCGFRYGFSFSMGGDCSNLTVARLGRSDAVIEEVNR